MTLSNKYRTASLLKLLTYQTTKICLDSILKRKYTFITEVYFGNFEEVCVKKIVYWCMCLLGAVGWMYAIIRSVF